MPNDNEKPVTKYTVIASGRLKPQDESDDYDVCEPRTTVYMIETDDDEPLNEVARDEIYDLFRLECWCAHDCCGHHNGGVTAISEMWKGRYLVTVNTLRNF